MTKYSELFDIYVAKFFDFLRRSKLKLFLISLLSFASGWMISYVIDNEYKSQALLYFENSNNASGANGLLSAFSNGNLSKEINKGALYLKSRDFVRAFKKQESLTSIKDIKEFSGLNIEISLLSTESVIELEVIWKDPKQSQFIASELISFLNDYYKENERRIAQEKIDLLENKLNESNNVNTRESLSQLIQSELNRLVLAESDSILFFEVLNSPNLPKSPSYPNRYLLALLIMFASVLSWVVKNLFFKEN